jgi:hypothetical protein
MTQEELDKLGHDKILEFWNTFCKKNQLLSELNMVYLNDEPAHEILDLSVINMLIAETNEEYDWEEKYVTSDGLGRPRSSDDPKNLMDIDALFEWLNDEW